MKHIVTIIDKEWSELFKNRMIISVTLLLPLIFTALPLFMLSQTSSTVFADTGLESNGLPANFLAVCQGMTAGECTQVYIMNEFLLLFMLMPLIIPITIAAYSVVGEKTTRSLEPLLATPISTAELLAGKTLAAVIPGILATYLAFGVFNLGMLILKISPAVIGYVDSPTWLLGIIVLGPIMAVIAVIFALYVSSRVNDPRAAEQISSVVILPLMTVLFLQLAGVVVINVPFMLIAIAIALGLAFAALQLGTVIFDRENILTRWK